MRSFAPGASASRTADGSRCPSSDTSKFPPAIATGSAAPSAVTSMPPSDTSIAVAPAAAPTARLAVAIARRSIGPAAVTP